MAEDKKLNEIIRVKRVVGTFATMNKGFLEDERLSLKAKGILAYLLSKPDDWKVIVGDIVKHCKDSKSAIYSGLKELKENGYYKKIPVRSEDGTRIVRWESTVYEVPFEVLSDEVAEQEETSILEQAVTRIKEKITKKKQPATKVIEKEEKTEQLVTKLEEKTRKTEQQQSVALFPNFQEVENQFIENGERNNNYNTNNYYTKKLNHSLSQTGYQTGQDHIFRVLDFIKRKIDYKSLEMKYESDMPLVDEFVSVILDTILSTSETVRINGQNKPRELVKSQLMKLTYQEFEFVLDKFKTLKQKIKKKHQYILSMLYNAKMELNTHYTNLVQVDFGY